MPDYQRIYSATIDGVDASFTVDPEDESHPDHPANRMDVVLAAEAFGPCVVDAIRSTRGHGPYVELNGMYKGVRVRRITYLPDLDDACYALDKVYDRVMGLEDETCSSE